MFPHPVHVITSSFPLQLLEIFFGNQLPCISLKYNAMHSICVPQKNSVVFQSHDCMNFVGGRGSGLFEFCGWKGRIVTLSIMEGKRVPEVVSGTVRSSLMVRTLLMNLSNSL